MIWAERRGSFSSASLAPVTNASLAPGPRGACARSRCLLRCPARVRCCLLLGTALCEPCKMLSVVPFSAGHLNCNFMHVTCCNLNCKSTHTCFFAMSVILALLFAAWAGLCPQLRVHYMNFVFKLQAGCLWVLWRCRRGSGVRRGMAGSWVWRSWGVPPCTAGATRGVRGSSPVSFPHLAQQGTAAGLPRAVG